METPKAEAKAKAEAMLLKGWKRWGLRSPSCQLVQRHHQHSPQQDAKARPKAEAKAKAEATLLKRWKRWGLGSPS